ncbi:uncharacterized protein SPAPADRAFT_131743 [Spathaspora passalidarum NRRL Y-27907]|uniref:UBA domain-containing protein n=1 Tax=Spathaspora passalidarum (strain NRRL Y-27907 / 11-Y1) TaxID=619300 RepID=G3ADV9_SPAPN|nr:uncharacterized protein SPAPADRAFT_131743 [Spathaspora passalidarum NRRL Y-27907]EGW34683.1 hypothetical protein SPAPADRAFT_131743 [Spathaspora passalidarum NRRL Y-27907]
MDQGKVQQLQEMGFSRDQAESALQKTNYVLESAIAYLFGEPLEQPQPQPQPPPSSPSVNHQMEQGQLIRYEDTVHITNPEDIPSFTEFANPSDSNSNMQSRSNLYEYHQNIESSSSDSSSSIHPFSIYEHYNTLARDGEEEYSPPVILPYRLRAPQNILIPILTIASSLSQFNKILFTRNNFDYGYVENWYDSQAKSELAVPEEFTTNKHSYKFVVEVQKIVGYLSHGLSKRLLISAESLLSTLPTEFYTSLLQSEGLDELLKKVYACLAQESDLVLDNDGDSSLSSIFNSVVRNEEGDEVELPVFEIDSDSRGSTITESLDNLFWNSDDGVGNVSFCRIAPLFTFHVLNYDDGDYSNQSMQLQEHFYPGVYGSECVALVTSMSRKRLEVAKERSLISNRIMNLSSFEGKKIRHILQKSIDYLGSTGKEAESHDDLLRLADNLKEETVVLNDKLRQLNHEYLQLDVNNHDNILERISHDPTIKAPEKYILIGIILSDSEYLYKTKTSKTPDQDWVYFSLTATPDNIVNDFRMEIMDFESVNIFFAEASKSSGDQFTLIYASESSFTNQEEVDFGVNLTEFFKSDNHHLQQEIKRSQTQSEQELEISNEEEDEASSMQETPNPEGANPDFAKVSAPSSVTARESLKSESPSDTMLIDL